MRLPRLLTSLLLFTILVTTGAGCFGGGGTNAADEKVTLNYWRVFEDDDAFNDIIDSYRAIHPNVTIRYRKLRYEDYRDEVIKAIAEGNGPDILSLHNTWLHEFQDLLLPLPPTVNISYYETQGTLRKETVQVTREESTLSTRALKQQFVETVPVDVMLPYQADPKQDPVDRIYGLPLSVDTLAVFYNKDLLNAANIAEPPSTWEAFHEAVKKLSTFDAQGNLIQSGAALGTSGNVERATDILTLLMLQNGTQMTDDRGRVAFHTIPDDTPDGLFPGLDATRFYTEFANPAKDVYTWNDTFPNSYEAFATGQTAFFFGYSYHLPLLKADAPKLNLGVAAMPQISDSRKVNLANYWVESVSKASAHSDWAWDFIEYATQAEHVTSYLNKAQKPTALRSLIATQIDDENISVFANQVLTAKSWYRGKDIDAAEKGLADLIDTILAGTDEPEKAIQNAAQVVAQTY